MTKGKIVSFVGLFALMGCHIVFAENRPGVVTVSVADGYYHFAEKHKMQNTSIPNVSLAYNFTDHWAIEGTVGLLNTNTSSTNIQPNVSEHGYLYTAAGLYRFCPYWQFQPYVSAGIGVLGLKPNGTDSQHQGNLNVGVGTQWLVHKTIAFRAEARDIYTMTGGKNDYMISLGMSFLFCAC